MNTSGKTEVTRLLLAEPNNFDARIVISFVEKLPGREFIIDHVTSSVDALDHLERTAYDLLIVNLELKDSSGIETLERLVGYIGETPILVLTSGHQQEVVPAAVKLGALDFVSVEQISFKGLWRSINFVIDRKKIEVELTRAKDRNKRASDAKTQFISNVTHELRNPLNSILGMSEVLMDLSENYEQQKVIKGIQSSGNQLLSLVNDLLDVAKIESGKMEMIEEVVNVEAFIENIVELTVIRAHKKNIEFYCNIDKKVPFLVESDSHKLKQVITNILSNAIKFTNKGHISLEVKIVGGHEAGPMLETLQFSIADTGIGMKEEERVCIFEKFGQANPNINSQFGGTGLGLHISKQFIDFVKGTIKVESTAGVGSKFIVEIPVRVIEQELSVEKVSLPLGSKVLFLGLNESTQLTQRFFKEVGFSVQSTNSLMREELLESPEIEWYVIDLCVVDGGFDLELTQLINFKTKNEGQKIIALIPYNFDSKHIEVLKSAGVLFVMKPARRSEVISIIKQGLQQSPMASMPKNFYLGSGPFGSPVTTAYRPPDSGPNKESSNFPRVLIVDDSEDNRNLYSLYLKNLELNLDYAENGMEAINLYRVKNYDLILMDLQMPIMDGVTAIGKIRKIESEAGSFSVPILAISGVSVDDLKEDPCSMLQCTGYLEKPLSKKSFLSQIKKMLNHNLRKVS